VAAVTATRDGGEEAIMLATGETIVATGRWLAKGGLPRLVIITATSLSDFSFPYGRDESRLIALYPESKVYSVRIGASLDNLSMASQHFGSLAEARGWVEGRGWKPMTWGPQSPGSSSL
jgi:hypothetical protein